MEDRMDHLLAGAGYNSSMGLGQVKLETAIWIEENINDPSSNYYLGEDHRPLLRQSVSRLDLVQKLATDSSNLLYVTAYLEMIKHRWKAAGTPLDTSISVVASLYALGAMKANGDERMPHGHAEPNQFGRVAEQFYREISSWTWN
jgi:hypothetical protein